VVAIFAKKKLIAVLYQFNVKLHIWRSPSILPTKGDERILAPPWFGGWGIEFYTASGKIGITHPTTTHSTENPTTVKH